jgi:hypothetical protein
VGDALPVLWATLLLFESQIAIAER